jgi:hypothetical protein
MTRTLVCLVLLPLLVASYSGSYGSGSGSSSGSYSSGNKKNTAKAPSSEPVVHVGTTGAEGADVQQWDAGTARVVAHDRDAYDTFAAAVQYTAHMFVNGVEGTFHAITRAIQFVDETFAITRRVLRTWSVLSGWFGALAHAGLSAVQYMFSALGDLFTSCFEAVSRAVELLADVLRTVYLWLEDNVFRVVRDVMRQVYRWAKDAWERGVAAMMPLIHAFRSALESAFILARPLVDKLMWYACSAFEIVETAAAIARDWICVRLRSLSDLVSNAASFVSM